MYFAKITAFFAFFLVLYICRECISLDLKKELSGLNTSLEVEDELVFFVFGDAGSGDSDQELVAELMEKRCQKISRLDGLLLTGDNIYPSGAKNAKDPAFKSIIEVPYGKPCLNKIPFYPVLGNHDYKGNPKAEVNYSALNPRWHMPHRFYSVSFGSLVKLIAFDSTISDFCLNPLTCTGDFLLEEASSSKSQWTFALAHHPLTSASKKTNSHSGNNLLSYFLKPFVCKNIDAWFAGHSHHLEQRKLKECKTQFFVSGAGGAHLDTPDFTQKESLFVKRGYGFLEIHIERNTLTSRFFTAKGLLFERKQTKS